MKRRLWVCTLAAAIAATASPARAGIEPFLGELMLTGHDFCPDGWLPAQGQLLPISQNTALFSLLGTTFGGNGQTTFALPDLRGRTPIGEGQGPGLTSRTLGEQGGQESVTLLSTEMPAHTHAAGATSLPGNTASPAGALPARKIRTNLYRIGSSPNTTMAPGAIATAGASQPHENMPPFLAMTWCIATEGIYPSRP